MSTFDYLNLVFVGADQLVPLAVGLLLWIGLAGLGALVAGRNAAIEANVIFGWAAISTVYTLVGVVIRAPFLVLTLIAALAAVAGIIVALRRGQALLVPGSWRILVLAIPIFLIAGAMEPSQWDEFSHWLPAPDYLLAFDGFPNAERPNNGPHMLSAYPYGWPLLSYLAGRIAGGQLFNIGGILNILLLLSFATYALRTVLQIVGRRQDRPQDNIIDKRIGWGLAAAIVIAATIAPPTFVQKIVLTAYSDVSTSVVTGYCVLIGYHFIESLGGRGRGPPLSAAWQLCLVFMLLINLRQPNLVLFLVLVLALALLALRAPEVRFGRFAGYLPLIGVPALIVYFAWRAYVGAELAAFAGSEANLRPFELWNIPQIPGILAQMAVVAGKKIGFFGVMLVACAFALVGLFRLRGGGDRLGLIAAAGFAGYNVFLLFTYVAHFGTQNALNVVSYWRYNNQIGALAIISTLLGAVYLWNRILGFDQAFAWEIVWPRRIALILVLALPIVFAPKLRFDLEPPKPHYTAVAKDLKAAGLVPGRLFVMDPRGTGEAAVMSRFYLGKQGTPWMSGFTAPNPASIRKYLGKLKQGDFLLVHSISDGLAKSLSHPLDARQSYLFRREADSWTFLKAWPKPANHPY